MRCLLAAILIFLITSSGFAMKPVSSQPALHSKTILNNRFIKLVFSKTSSEDESSLTKDDLEHPSLIQQAIKKHTVSSIQLFNRVVSNSIQDLSFKNYNSERTTLHYNFIYHFLYPKHFFW